MASGRLVIGAMQGDKANCGKIRLAIEPLVGTMEPWESATFVPTFGIFDPYACHSFAGGGLIGIHVQLVPRPKLDWCLSDWVR